MAKPPAVEQVQVNFRMPSELRDKIKESAEKNNRSMNAEIVVALEMFLGVTGGKSLRDYNDRATFDLSGLPEEEQLRRIVQSSAQTMYEELKKSLRAPPADISNPPDSSFHFDDEK
tara:strand:- start:345 stop:692 length:348 start_codon:yes stop_codon:yes gene_type:complete